MFCDDIALVMMFKRPKPGQGKQRLAVTLGNEAAFRIASCLFDTGCQLLNSWRGIAVAAPADPADTAWAADHFGMQVRYCDQGAGNLGQRINHIDRNLRAEGISKVLFIGSDAPELSLPLLNEAAAALADHDMVVIPSGDGGVSLMGGCQPWPEIADLPWSTPQLGEALGDCCRKAGLSFAAVEHCDDLDELADLEQLLQRWQGAQLTVGQQALYSAGIEILEARNGTHS